MIDSTQVKREELLFHCDTGLAPTQISTQCLDLFRPVEAGPTVGVAQSRDVFLPCRFGTILTRPAEPGMCCCRGSADTLVSFPPRYYRFFVWPGFSIQRDVMLELAAPHSACQHPGQKCNTSRTVGKREFCRFHLCRHFAKSLPRPRIELYIQPSKRDTPLLEFKRWVFHLCPLCVVTKSNYAMSVGNSQRVFGTVFTSSSWMIIASP